MDNPKFNLQDTEYVFPYHYLAYLNNGVPQIKKSIGWDWGYNYLTYMNSVIDTIKKLPHENILDIGCGDGYLLNHLDSNSDKLGIDLSERAIAFANALSNNAKFKIKDLLTLENQFDIVCLIEVLEHIPNDFIEKFMTHTLKLVKKGGYFVISVPTTVIPLAEKHYRHYDEELLSKHIENYGEVELVEEKRVYKESKLSKYIIKFLNNRFWSINSSLILSKYWKWHMKNNVISNKTNGFHLLRVYKKK